jgi:hypothetical protein
MLVREEEFFAAQPVPLSRVSGSLLLIAWESCALLSCAVRSWRVAAPALRLCLLDYCWSLHTTRHGVLVDRYDPEDIFARVLEVVEQTDRVLKALDRLLDDDQLYSQVRTDLGKLSRLTDTGAWATFHTGGGAPTPAFVQAPLRVELRRDARAGGQLVEACQAAR